MVEIVRPNPSEQAIDAILREIEQAIQQKNFVWIQDLLDNAQEQERYTQDRRRRAELQDKLRQLRILRSQKIQEIENAIRTGLAADIHDSAQVENALDELAAIDNGHPSLDHWRTRLADQRQQVRQVAHVQEIEAELKRLWHEAEEAEQAGLHGVPLLGLYENARDHAERMAANYDLPKVKGLVQQATDLYNRVRQRHEIAMTRQLTSEYRSLLEQLRQMAPAEPVLVAKDMQNTHDSLATMPAGEAIKLLENQAREYAAQKATDYRNKALEHLDDHAPGAAEKQLRLALDLFSLDQEQRTVTEKLLNERVIPALQLRQDAEAKLRSAERQGTPRRRWELLMEAQARDPFLPDLEKVREALLPGVEAYLEERLREARHCLSDADRPNWTQAEQLATEVRLIAEQEGAFQSYVSGAESVRIEAESWHRLEQEIHDAVTTAKAGLADDAHAVYDELLARQAIWGDRANRFPELAQCLASVQVHVNIAALLERLQQAVYDPDPMTVEAALRDCESALQEHSPQRTQLDQVRRRLRLHYDFLSGAALMGNPERTVTDERKGVELLSRVIAGNGDDRAKAQELTNSIREDQEASQDLQRTLQRARRLLEQENYQAAYNELLPQRHWPEAAELLDKTAREWEKWLESQLKQALANRTLDERRTKQWVHDLETIGSVSASDWRRQVYSRCAAQRAQTLIQRPNPNWQELLKAWDEALEMDPDNPEYQDERRSADKQLVRSGLSRAPQERITGLQELATKYPSDLETRIWLIDALIEYINSLRDYSEVEQWARQGQIALGEAQHIAGLLPSSVRMASQLQERARQIDATLDIAQRCYDIAQQLRSDKLVDAWQRAVNQTHELQKTYPDHSKLEVWWRQTKSNALTDAQRRLTDRQTAGADVWDQIHPASQVLLLDPNNNTARQAIQAVYEALLVLEGQLTKLEQDRTGAGYPGTHEEILDHQLREAQELRRKLMLAEQVLMNFGGQFQDPSAQRGKIKELVVRNQRLIERLEQLRRYLNTGRLAINQAKTDDSSWYAFDEQRRLITDGGYSHHLTVIALDKQKDAIRKKQQHLRQLRQQIEQAAADGQINEALRLSELMLGQPISTNHSQSSPMTQPTAPDELADPNDDFGEQARVRVQDPHTRRMVVGLRRLVPMLREQAVQVDAIRAWLPTLPTFSHQDATVSGVTVKQPIVTWQKVSGEVDRLVEEGKFEESRQLLRQLVAGNGTGYYGDALALQPALDLLNQPPVTEAALSSREAERLWRFGRQLYERSQADLNAVYGRLSRINQLELEWQDCYQRFISVTETVRDYKERHSGLFGFLRRGELRHLQAEARAAYNMCERLCPKHPDLVGWANHAYLGG